MDGATAHWDVGRLIKDLGGPARIQQLTLAEGLEVPAIRNLRAWSSRDRVPAEGLALLLLLARRIVQSFDPFAYIVLSTPDGEEAA